MISKINKLDWNQYQYQYKYILQFDKSVSLYPLVTHDPNMLKNKSRGNLVGKIKVSLPEGKYKKFARNSSH